MPASLVGATWLRTANVSRAYAGNPVAGFGISQAASVYVAVDDRSAALSWLAGWTNTGLKLVNNESSPKSFTLFQKSFPAGTVSLGPQNNSGVGMYTVVVK